MFINKLINIFTFETYSMEILYLAFLILFLYLIFLKTGEKGWKAFIPVYNIYILFKLTGKEKKFIYFVIFLFIMFLLPVLFYVLNIGNNFIGGTFASLQVICFAILILITIDVLITLFECFGHSALFVIGFFVFPLIFLGIIALDDSKYKPIKKKQKNKKKKDD